MYSDRDLRHERVKTTAHLRFAINYLGNCQESEGRDTKKHGLGTTFFRDFSRSNIYDLMKSQFQSQSLEVESIVPYEMSRT